MGVSDVNVLRYATRVGRAVLTLNRRHFIALHAEQPRHGGIIVCTVDLDFSGQSQRIHEQITKLGRLDGQLIRVNRPNR